MTPNDPKIELDYLYQIEVKYGTRQKFNYHDWDKHGRITIYHQQAANIQRFGDHRLGSGSLIMLILEIKETNLT